MHNPFKYGLAVDESSFCNRENEQKQVLAAIRTGQRLFIHAERRLGKTSLVRLVLDKLPKREYVGVYVDLWATNDEADFVETYARGLTIAATSRPEKMLEFARNIFSRLMPSVTIDDEGKPQINFDFSRRPTEMRPTLQSIIEAPSVISKKLKKKLVVVFDEFQRVLEYEDDLVERMLRSAIQFQPDIAYIFLGSRKHLIQKLVIDKSRPFYKAGPHFSLGSIATSHWLEFVKVRFERACKLISNDQIAKICELTDGHPFYTQHLCHALWDLTEENTVVSDDKIAAAVNQVLAHEDYAYSMMWDLLATSQRKLMEGIAFEGPNVEIYSGGFLRKYDINSAATAQRAAKALVDRELIDKETRSYFVVDRFFRLWIRRIHD